MQQNTDGLAPYLGNQLALDRFLGHQSHGPAGIACRGIGANHGDDPLALTLVQPHGRTGALLVVQRPVQPNVLVATANLTDRLRSEPDIGGHLGRRLALVQLGESQGTENDPNLLDAATEKPVQLVSVPLGQPDVEATIGPHDPV